MQDSVPANPSGVIYCRLGRALLQPSTRRLSWPHAGDGRRAIVGKSPAVGQRPRDPPVDLDHMVHVSQRDIEMHYHFASSAAGTMPLLDIPLAWNPTALDVGSQELLPYFQHTAYKALAAFGHDPVELGGTLIRAALSSNSPLSTAVLQSLLAFSALHRHGVCPQAVELKISALKSIGEAPVGENLSAAEAVQHVAAGMLLCSWEVHQSSCTSGEWRCYVRGVKGIMQISGLGKEQQDNDVSTLLDWVYYHDVHARFCLRHWRRAAREKSPSPPPVNAVSQAPPPALTLIELLSELCDAVDPQGPAMTDEHIEYLRILDWRIRSTTVPPSAHDTANTPLVTELYKHAMLVYLNRATNNILNQGARTKEVIEKSFATFVQLGSCDRQFPVFILGCEARTDAQRAIVLDLISRTEKGVSSRSFNHVRILVQAIWAQDDLAAVEIGYWDKLSYVISCCGIMPTFV
ncbi:fungal-specific transcription factor domain-containing protein [Podospora didyma]|uniref:Fungal-specific transcription factor domain-containing protein n=1 Tax=Podospora didyma TaxID=330526 RepID=A0AAE0KDW4_9PEZI|nr:fungal-specific transcription factor domain-containing protein [Podospora didyma]